MKPELKTAFRFHLRRVQAAGRGRVELGLNGPLSYTEQAMKASRDDLAKNVKRYPGPVKPYPAAGAPDERGLRYVENPESCGFRFVGRVSPEFRRGPFGGRDSEGWLTDPYGATSKDGTGLCWGEVWQIAGRNGESHFVAGYRFGGNDGGPCLDLRRVFTFETDSSGYAPAEDYRLTDAARHADELAQQAAEQEREYQTAWCAGANYAAEGEDIRDARAELLAILKERRAAIRNAGLSDPAYFALCDVIRNRVKSLLRDISKARKNRAKLANGEHEELYFWAGDKRLRDAFCDGAGIDHFPA